MRTSGVQWGTRLRRDDPRAMPKALLRFFLLMLTGMTLVATSSVAGVSGPVCDDCCAYSSAASGCASVCSPAAPAAQADEQSPAKPLGASFFAAAHAWFTVPARAPLSIPRGMRHPPGPPVYLSFGRLLL